MNESVNRPTALDNLLYAISVRRQGWKGGELFFKLWLSRECLDPINPDAVEELTRPCVAQVAPPRCLSVSKQSRPSRVYDVLRSAIEIEAGLLKPCISSKWILVLVLPSATPSSAIFHRDVSL